MIGGTAKSKDMEQTLRDERDKAHAYFDFLAHDMANILSPIMIYSEMLNTDHKIPADLKFKIDKIMEQSQRAYSLIQTLRKLEEMGNVPPDQIEIIDLRTAISTVEDTVRAEYPAKSFTINYEIPRLERIPVRGGNWVEDVILKVVENAVMHSSKESVAIEIKVAPIKDESGRSFWEVEISDNGPGIDDNQKELLVTPLTITRRDFNGVGSSLPLCSSILQSLGGSLKIEDRILSCPDQGTKIVIRLVKGE